MSFLVLATSQWQTDRIAKTIRRELDTQVLLATRVAEAADLLAVHGNSVEVAVIDTNHLFDVVVPFVELLERKYRHIGTLLLSSHIPEASLVDLATLRTRVDESLRKPFHETLLLNAFIRTHEKRIRKNRDLFLLSHEPFHEILPEINVVRHESLSGIDIGPDVKGIMIDSQSFSVDQALRLKKHLRSLQRPIAIWGTESDAAWQLNDVATHFFPTGHSLSECVLEFSGIAEHSLQRRLLIQRIKLAQTANLPRKVVKLAEELIGLDRWCSQAYTAEARAYATLGKKAAAIENYEFAIETNPFYPENYLALAELDPKIFQGTPLLERAQKYCPLHPQLKQYFETGGLIVAR